MKFAKTAHRGRVERRRPWTGPLYLDVQQLRPGDVLLTRKWSHPAKAAATRGPFSHAALYLSSCLLLESDRTGVGPSPLLIHRVEVRADGRRVLSRLAGISRAIVLRHLALAEVDSDEGVSDRLFKVAEPFLGREYSELQELAETLAQGHSRNVARVLLGMIDKASGKRKVLPGPFCSQFVAELLKAVGCPAFEEGVDLVTVSPNSFLASTLKPVDWAVCVADKTARLDKAYADILNGFQRLVGLDSRELSTGTLVTLRTTVARLEETVGLWQQLRATKIGEKTRQRTR